MPDSDQEKISQEKALRIERQIGFAAGLFQEDVTVRTLLESLSEGVVVIDNSGTILFVNARAEQIFGYPTKELIGKLHSLLIPERFRKVHEEHETHYFDAPKTRPMGQKIDLAGLRRDGSEFPMEISLSFIETINGVLVLALASDINLRKQVDIAAAKGGAVSYTVGMREGVCDLHRRRTGKRSELECGCRAPEGVSGRGYSREKFLLFLHRRG